MPVHDWTRVNNTGIFHHFHQMWVPELATALNNGLLPPDLYALVEQNTRPMNADVLTLQLADGSGLPPAPSVEAGLSVATAPPRVRVRRRMDEATVYARRASFATVRHTSDHSIVAVVEIVSPGNKRSESEFDRFVEKSVGFIQTGVHLLVIDLFPPTPRDPDGVHSAIWTALGETADPVPAGEPLVLAGYSASAVPEAFVEPTAVGRVLPDMPLFLSTERYVDVPLEATYAAAWARVPSHWRGVVGG